MTLRKVLLLALGGYILLLTLSCEIQQSEPEGLPTPVPSTQDLPALTRAEVSRVISGVTLEVEIEGQIYGVRYLGIDIPAEVAGEGGRPISQEALEFNRFLVEGRSVELEQDEVETDYANNLLRYVYVDGEMVNKALLANGFARVVPNLEPFRYQTEFLIAEEAAKTNLRGIWKVAANPHPEESPGFSGGTLPQIPIGSAGSILCDFTGSKEPAIKGNVDPRTGAATYYVPGSLFYDTTVVEEAAGDRWFCTEAEAVSFGWKKATR